MIDRALISTIKTVAAICLFLAALHIPVHTAAQSNSSPLDDLAGARDPDTGWIGINVQSITSDLARRNGLDRPVGALIVGTDKYGAARRAGLRPDDILVAVNGKPALNVTEVGALLAKIWPGQTARLFILRDGEKLEIDVKVGSLIADNEVSAREGDAEAMLMLGLAYEDGRGTEKSPEYAAQWYRKAAALNQPMAQFRLYLMYLTGNGVPRDEARAIDWLKRSSADGYARAQTFLAQRYLNGIGLPRDYAQAKHWYELAAEQNDEVAITGLGIMYASGLGVREDPVRAAGYYSLAAEMGSVPAMNNLARLYWTGQGVRHDRNEAARLWREAALKGGKAAAENLRKLKLDQLDPADVQRLLNTLGYEAGPADGSIGPTTQSAIRSYQQEHNLPIDGEVSLRLYVSLVAAEQDLYRASLIDRLSISKPAPQVTGDEEKDENLEALD